MLYRICPAGLVKNSKNKSLAANKRFIILHTKWVNVKFKRKKIERG